MARIKPLHFLPNLTTLANLLCGCLGLVWALSHNIQLAVYMIWLSALLDFADGMIARLMGVSSELGKQLDSLADLVSFGLLPSAVIFTLSSTYLPGLWPYWSFLMVLFSAVRLAKFNLDSDQGMDFKGLPTPANALLISSFPAIIDHNYQFLRPGLENPLLWFFTVGLLSYLLISKVRLFGLKFRNFSWRENKYRYLFIGISLTLGLFLGIVAVPVIVLLYFTMSLFQQYQVF